MQGVPLNQGNLAASLANIIATYELTAKDKSLVVMPLFHVHGLMAGQRDFHAHLLALPPSFAFMTGCMHGSTSTVQDGRLLRRQRLVCHPDLVLSTPECSVQSDSPIIRMTLVHEACTSTHSYSQVILPADHSHICMAVMAKQGLSCLLPCLFALCMICKHAAHIIRQA